MRMRVVLTLLLFAGCTERLQQREYTLHGQVITVAADQITQAPPDQSGKNDHLIAAVVQRNEQVIRLVDPSALLRHSTAG